MIHKRGCGAPCLPTSQTFRYILPCVSCGARLHTSLLRPRRHAAVHVSDSSLFDSYGTAAVLADAAEFCTNSSPSPPFVPTARLHPCCAHVGTPLSTSSTPPCLTRTAPLASWPSMEGAWGCAELAVGEAPYTCTYVPCYALLLPACPQSIVLGVSSSALCDFRQSMLQTLCTASDASDDVLLHITREPSYTKLESAIDKVEPRRFVAAQL